MLVGTAKEKLDFADGVGLFGFGWFGGRGVAVPVGSDDFDVLQARALWMESDGTKLLVISYDLPYGSRLVHAALLKRLAEKGIDLEPGNLWIVGTHTHSGPGQFLGNFYDLFGQYPIGIDYKVLHEIVDAGLRAAEKAIATKMECSVGIAQVELFRAGRNRSLRAFLANFRGDLTEWRRSSSQNAPGDLTPEEISVDHRLTVIAFVREGRAIATWAIWACHPATIPRKPRRAFHRDWPGVAVDRMDAVAGFSIVSQGASGDVTSLPSGARRVERPFDRIRELGERVAGAWRRGLEQAIEEAGPAEMELAFHRFVPQQEGLPPWEIGFPVIIGSEEFNPGWTGRVFGEERRLPIRLSKDQRPKLPVGWPFSRIIPRLLRIGPSPEHPMWLLKLRDHLFFASPFEQTTYAARTIERALCDRWKAARGRAVRATAIGLVGDYAGYLATPDEFDRQCYEGAHTLYGRRQLEVLREAWSRMITRDPLRLDQKRAIDEEALARKLAKIGK